MSHIERFAHVNYSCEQMFALVNDIDSYPEFLPGCMGATLISRTPSEIVASLEVGKGPIRQSFTTKNFLQSHHRIEMTLVKGPFKRLHGVWTFTELSPTRCKIMLSINFELSGMLKFAFGSVFSQIANAMVDAFSKRAKIVYGE
ncbi:type II toxin-antitoxin system RatA family toxin [Marinomonas sp. M1K-6]|uniref:Type II toxin-antitoxin system RatA family toxin n=1 Tax=Marinomonas profundi TaxID=2726122 RepID=A0A847R141_9GAMM|nr:type II toxin-antitoxin system RatA family toxin [Marinomonas profundi]NLQ17401.1 type II toxin-antitoxin system RatA family toxin [Marinomonas profundi]UDV01927.1 type II toxin-antitoxin system RatA family toxin [Marinomonas profundi]